MSEHSDKPRLLSSEGVGNLVAPLAEKLDRTVGWDRLPPKLGMLVLLGLRQRLDSVRPEETSVSRIVFANAIDGPDWASSSGGAE